MPAEAPDRPCPSRVHMTGSPVQALCGLLFASLGPAPVPQLPRWERCVWAHVLRAIGATLMPCHWLQSMETPWTRCLGSGGTAAWPMTGWNGWGVRMCRGPCIGRAPMGRAAGSTRTSAATSSRMGSCNGVGWQAGLRRTRHGASGIPSSCRTSCAVGAMFRIGSRSTLPTSCMGGARPLPSLLVLRCQRRTRCHAPRYRSQQRHPPVASHAAATAGDCRGWRGAHACVPCPRRARVHRSAVGGVRRPLGRYAARHHAADGSGGQVGASVARHGGEMRRRAGMRGTGALALSWDRALPTSCHR